MFQTTNQSWVDMEHHGIFWYSMIWYEYQHGHCPKCLLYHFESPVEFISWDHPQLSCTHYDVIMISISYLPLLEAYHDHVYWCPVFLRSWASPGLISNPTNIHRKSKSSHNPRACRNECTSYYSRISCMKNLNGWTRGFGQPKDCKPKIGLINIWGWVKTLVPSEPQNSW